MKNIRRKRCFIYGIDAVSEFIESAREKAIAFGVEHLCEFEKGDIRERSKDLQGYDVIILGSIGPVFGDFHSTLKTLSKCIHENGIFIIDEGYMDDESPFKHPQIQKKEILQQIEMAGMQLIEEKSSPGKLPETWMNNEQVSIIEASVLEISEERMDLWNQWKGQMPVIYNK